MKELTIAIPTYNRHKELLVLLNSILASPKALVDRIQILVLDNASDGDTKAAIEHLFSPELDLKYLSNETNIGGNANISLALSLSNSEYTWVFGDDDVFYKESLELVLSALQSKPVVLICNYDLLSSDLSSMLRCGYLGSRRSVETAGHALMMFHLKLGFISCVVVRTQSILTYQADIITGVQLSFPFVTAIYKAMCRPDGFRYLKESVFACRQGNSNLALWERVFVENGMAVLKSLSEHYSPFSTWVASECLLLTYSLPHLVDLILAGKARSRFLWICMRNFPFRLSLFFVLLPVASVPTFLARTLRFAKRSFGSVARK